jgi:hypothetical protein
MDITAQMQSLAEWRDFYVMVGTASGAIVGANFVVVTLTAGQEKRVIGVRGFISPTAVHLGSVLVGSAVLAIPGITALALAILLGLGGVAGTIYSMVVLTRIWKMPLALEDRCCYALAPFAAYLIMLAAAVMIVARIDSPLYMLAGSLLLLLVIGMRNAWDMASFMVVNQSGSRKP